MRDNFIVIQNIYISTINLNARYINQHNFNNFQLAYYIKENLD